MNHPKPVSARHLYICNISPGHRTKCLQHSFSQTILMLFSSRSTSKFTSNVPDPPCSLTIHKFLIKIHIKLMRHCTSIDYKLLQHGNQLTMGRVMKSICPYKTCTSINQDKDIICTPHSTTIIIFSMHMNNIEKCGWTRNWIGTFPTQLIQVWEEFLQKTMQYQLYLEWLP